MNPLSFIRRAFSRRQTSRPEPAQPPIRGRYDAAQDSNEIKNLWAVVDQLDADASNTLAIRKKLRNRSRNERANNGHCAGVIRTHANYIVGTGPKLRLQTRSVPFNQMVEAAWGRWCESTGFMRKLRTMCRAKTGDGEAFALLVGNPNIEHKVKLDVCLVECDQVSAPVGVSQTERYVDGIHFDEYGNPQFYDVLNRHPGASWFQAGPQEFTTYAARFVCHWFGGDERPGQHRGIPELTPSLNLFGTGRRYREAVVAAAETAADLSVMIQMGTTNEGNDEAAPFTSLPIEKRTMTVTPAGATASQMKAEQPATTYDAFNRNMICEEARPLNMPYNIAACDSSGYSYSGGQLDHLTYFVSVDVERQDCESAVLNRVFAVWFNEARAAYGWGVLASPSPRHSWNWPAKPQTDPVKTASARKTNLSDGTTTLGRIYAEDGLDFEDEVVAMAHEYGVTVEEMRVKLLDSNMQKSGGGGAAPPDGKDEPDADETIPPTKAHSRFTVPSNGNGHIHGVLT